MLLAGCGFERGDDPVEEVSASTVDAVIGADNGATPDAVTGEVAPSDGAPTDAPPTDVPPTGPSFATEVHGILLSECGQCHRSGGPRQLLLSDDAAADYDSVVKIVNVSDPAGSKLLKKGTGESQHGGGPTLKGSSQEYATILAWITAGALP